MHPVKTKYTFKLILGLAFLSAVGLLVYWLLFVYGVRNWLALAAIGFFLVLPGLKAVSSIPNEIRALLLVWRSEDPEVVDQALGDIRERGGSL